MAQHHQYTDPADLHEEKHARDAAAGTTLQFQGDGTGLAVLAQIGQGNIVVASLAQALSGLDTARAYLKFTTALTGAIAITTPNTWGPVAVCNGCTGAASLTLKTAAGSGVAVTAGKTCLLLANGTDVIAISPEV